MSRHTYITTLAFGQEGEPGYSEVEVEVSYSVLWGAPEQGPTYDCGGQPPDPDEIDDIKLVKVDGKPRPWDKGFGFISDDEFETMVVEALEDHAQEMLAEAAEEEADRRYAAMEDREVY